MFSGSKPNMTKINLYHPINKEDKNKHSKKNAVQFLFAIPKLSLLGSRAHCLHPKPVHLCKVR